MKPLSGLPLESYTILLRDKMVYKQDLLFAEMSFGTCEARHE